MNPTDAVDALGALANGTRLEMFRRLVRAGDAGLAAGDLADALGVVPSTLSHHLARLESASLVRSRRESRHIFYTVSVPATRDLLSYLVDDCCQGQPELCDFMRGRPVREKC